MLHGVRAPPSDGRAQCIGSLCTLSPVSQSTAARLILSVRFVRAARHGHAKAQAMVGACYWDGIGVPQDVSKAVHW